MNRALRGGLFLWLLVSSGVAAVAADALDQAVSEDYDTHLRELFEHFHRNPELSFREQATAARIAKELRDLGVEVTEGVGGTGVVGMLRNGEGPSVLVRADMDGLPVAEASGLPYASTARGPDVTGREFPIMHACGHDVHITALVGAARALIATKKLWSGSVMLVAQPAEERIGGARAMLEDGLYARFGVPDFAIAFHVEASAPAGRIAVPRGLVASSSDSVDITVHGVGGHGAYPDQAKDPVYIAAQLVVALQGLVSREISPMEPGVVTVGSIHGGNKHNIISDRVELQLTVRSNSEAVRARLLDGIERMARGVGITAGLPDGLLPEVVRSAESTPTTVNDRALAERLHAALLADLGSEALFEFEPDGMGAEDFAYFVMTPERVPGAYMVVGGTPQAALDAAKGGGPKVASHHSALFRIEPRPAVISGVKAMTFSVLELLKRP